MSERVLLMVKKVSERRSPPRYALSKTIHDGRVADLVDMFFDIGVIGVRRTGNEIAIRSSIDAICHPTGAYPDFLPRSFRQAHVCAFS